jgi:hypothetical protein
MSARPGLLSSLAALLCLCACPAAMRGSGQQGIYGTFTVYGRTLDQRDCSGMVTQRDKDDCRKANEALVEEPYKGQVGVRNLLTRENLTVDLDATGSYRVTLPPGTYTVCLLGGDCSDPMEVPAGVFVTFGQRLPRQVPEGGVRPRP